MKMILFPRKLQGFMENQHFRGIRDPGAPIPARTETGFRPSASLPSRGRRRPARRRRPAAAAADPNPLKNKKKPTHFPFGRPAVTPSLQLGAKCHANHIEKH